jgi:hypothetical protein
VLRKGEEGKEELMAERQLKCQHRIYCLEKSPAEGVTRKEVEPIATYRLGVDIGELSGEEALLNGKILLE